MAAENTQVLIAKEVDDVMELLVSIVKDLKEKKELSDLLGHNLPLLMEAIAGVDQLDEEFKNERGPALAAVGLRLGELTDVLLG